MKWDAYRSLSIISKEYIGMTCLGSDLHEKCCHREIPIESILEIHTILGGLEAKAPSKATSSLKRLAKLSLCTQCHQRYATEIIQEWDDAIQDATRLYERGIGLKEENEAAKEKNARLKDKNRKLKDEREDLQRKLKEEKTRREQELAAIQVVQDMVMAYSKRLNDATIAEREATFQNMNDKLEIFVREMETLKPQLLSEQQTTEALRQSLQRVTDKLIRTKTQLRTAKEECSRRKDDLEKLQVEFVTARDMLEEEKGILDVQHAELRARVDGLMQELAYAKLHPFKIFFVDLLEVMAGWARSILTCFGRMRTAAFGRSSSQENVPSP